MASSADNASKLRKRKRLERNRLISEFMPGRKGGKFELPFGGNLTIPTGICNKKEVITCCKISSSDRHKYIPPLRRNSRKLLSEIFLLTSSAPNRKKQVQMQIPFYEENQKYWVVELLCRRLDNKEWDSMEFRIVEYYEGEDAKKNIEFQAEVGCLYTVVASPKREEFEVPVQGLLHNCNINHQVTVRFPKKATDEDLTCCVRAHPVSAEKVAILRKEAAAELYDLVHISHFFEVTTNIPKDFRRAVTVKLPLPKTPDQDLDVEKIKDDVAIIQYTTEEGWQLVDSPLKFYRNAVSFEVKSLGVFSVAITQPNRKKRVKESVKRIHADLNVSRGEVLAFLKLEEKLWWMLIQCVFLNQKDDVILAREEEGYIRLQHQILPVLNKSSRLTELESHSSGRLPPTKKASAEVPDLSLTHSVPYNISVHGEFRLSPSDPNNEDTSLRFHERLPENYRKFQIEPLPHVMEGNPRVLSGLISFNLTRVDPETDITQTLSVRKFDAEISRDAMVKYTEVVFEPEPEREPEVEPKEEESPPVSVPSQSDVEKPPKLRSNNTSDSLTRLLGKKKVERGTRESKALSGRSLRVLSKEVEQGLTLAIYLDISDSAITGMGFDALAKGQSLSDITYNILLLWKRLTSNQKENQVNLLVSALQEMGQNEIADVVQERHKQNQEITADCFRKDDIKDEDNYKAPKTFEFQFPGN